MKKVFVLMYLDSDEQTYANKVFLGVAEDRAGIEALRDRVLGDTELLDSFYDFNESDLGIEEVSSGEIYYNF